MNNIMTDRRLFNNDILILSPQMVSRLREVKKPNVFDANSKVFDKDGLFSTEIFGPIGTKRRNTMPGYIDLMIGILHPLIFTELCSLKSLYLEIFQGTTSAIFSKTLKDFVPVKEGEKGDTGYMFFMKHIDELVIPDSDSDMRMGKIDRVRLFGNTHSLITKWLVLPAGLRDYTEDESGTPSQDEINDTYRKLLSTVSMIRNTKLDENNIKLLDPLRLKIQMISVEIYKHFLTLQDGKNKFVQGKWAKRAIMHGTRNVITPLPIHIYDQRSPNKITCNHTVIGTYQFIKGILPITIHYLLSMFISRILNPNTDTALLVDPETLTTKLVTIPVKKRDDWLSQEGLNMTINKLAQDTVRSEPVKIDKYYMLLVYDDGKHVEIIFNTDELDPTLDKKYIRPITYIELMYMAIYDVRGKYPGFLTRYPVAGLGGIYPTVTYVKTTVNGRTVDFKMDGVIKTVYEYPRIGGEYFNSVAPHPTHLAKLVADFDGDTISWNALTSDESIIEINKLLLTKQYYLTPDMKLAYSIKTDVLELVLAHLAPPTDTVA